MTPKDVISSLDPQKIDAYERYWYGLIPKTNADIFRRYLFAFCSVHTTWESNVRGYEAIRDLAWLGDREELRKRLCLARCGMHNNRARFITEFAEKFWADPTAYQRNGDEPVFFLRNRLERNILGLGLAKTSFALEMIHPNADITCLDVHMLRLYTDKPTKVTENQYKEYEADWLGRCAGIKRCPYPARMAWWDARQGKEDSRYWSHVFE